MTKMTGINHQMAGPAIIQSNHPQNPYLKTSYDMYSISRADGESFGTRFGKMIWALLPMLLAVASVSAQIQASKTSGCIGLGQNLTVDFKPPATIPNNPALYNYAWNLDRGNTSTVYNPTGLYPLSASNGQATYTVTLTVTNKNTGAQAFSGTIPITVYPRPVVDFSVDKPTGCFPHKVRFIDNTVPTSGTITSRTWYFGDGTISSEPSPEHVYKLQNNFTVRLVVTQSSCPSDPASMQKTGFVNVTQGVVPAFDVQPTAGCTVPITVPLINKTTGPGTLTYEWTALTGGILTGGATNVDNTASFTSTGTYDVRLVAKSSAGCLDTIVKKVLVPSNNITAGFNIKVNGNVITTPVVPVCQDAPVYFENTNPGTNAGDNIWTFTSPTGTVTTESGVHINKIFNTPGAVSVKLESRAGACGSTTTPRQLTIISAPSVSISSSNSRFSCVANYGVNFSLTGADPGDIIDWNFGDGKVMTGTAPDPAILQPSNTYLNFGSYPVKVNVKKSNGCIVPKIEDNFVVISQPTMTTQNMKDSGCAPFSFNPLVTVNAPGASVSYQWSIYDGTTIPTVFTSTSSNFSYTFNNTSPAGNPFVVDLKVSVNGTTCNSITDRGAVTVGRPPGTANFDALNTYVCTGVPIQFRDLSSPSGYGITSWKWEFGDGSSSTDRNPTYNYNIADEFTVSLTIYNNGCASTKTVRNKYISIQGATADFYYVPVCSTPRTYEFRNTSGIAQSYTWDFDETPPDGPLPSVNVKQDIIHTFKPTSTRPRVKLTVVSNTPSGTCTAVQQVYVNIIDEPATIIATPMAGTSLCDPTTQLTFSTVTTDPNNRSRFEWDLGNGVFSTTGPTASDVYNKGVYTIRLRVTDGYNCQKIGTYPLAIGRPEINFSASNTQGCKNSTINFNSTVSTATGTTSIIYNWDFGDGQTSALPSPSHTYLNTGSFTVKLRITDNRNCSNDLTFTNYINISAPIVNFSADKLKTCVGSPVQFQNSSSPVGAAVEWDFGDASMKSTDPNPIHTFNNIGNLSPTSTERTFSVKLTVTDGVGCKSDKDMNIVVDMPRAEIFPRNITTTSCPPFNPNFNSDNSHYAKSVLWDFGDGNISTNPTPNQIYLTPGTYAVQLTVTSWGGCTSTDNVSMTILGPKGDLSVDKTSGCNTLIPTFDLKNLSNVQSLIWDFNDGNIIPQTLSASATALNQTHTYSKIGTYRPSVTLISPNGCPVEYKLNQPINVFGVKAGFELSKSLLCDAGTVNFNDTSKIVGTLKNRVWDFGVTTPTPITAATGSIPYNTRGSYTVRLTIETAEGCSDVATPASVRVSSTPTVRISSPSNKCLGQPVTFNANILDQDPLYPANNWAWDFNNGSTASVQNPPDQTYTSAGNYNVQLKVSNILGCQNILPPFPVTVSPLPTVKLGNDTSLRIGQSLKLNSAVSSDVTKYNWTPPAGLSCTICPAPTATPIPSTSSLVTNYRLTVSNPGNCTSFDEISIKLICDNENLYIPNTFSPNNDGMNDVFYPRGTGLANIRMLRIFNRWGEMVYQKENFAANDKFSGWDGRYKGRELTTDVFVYFIEAVCLTTGELIQRRGDITLVR